MKKKNNYEISSGNIFADLELLNPEEMLAKAELARQINSLIEQKNLTQVAAAKLLGVDQPKVSALSKGKLLGFSLERLFRFLNILGQDISIRVTKASTRNKSKISITSSPSKKSPLKNQNNMYSHVPAIHARKKK